MNGGGGAGYDISLALSDASSAGLNSPFSATGGGGFGSRGAGAIIQQSGVPPWIVALTLVVVLIGVLAFFRR